MGTDCPPPPSEEIDGCAESCYDDYLDIYEGLYNGWLEGSVGCEEFLEGESVAYEQYKTCCEKATS